MKAEFLVRPIRSISGFTDRTTENPPGTLLKAVLAPAREGERRYPANIVIYGGASDAAESCARSVRAAVLPGDAIWRVGESPEEIPDGEFWVLADDPALELINARAIYLPEGPEYANVSQSWTKRADVALVQNGDPIFNAAEDYRYVGEAVLADTTLPPIMMPTEPSLPDLLHRIRQFSRETVRVLLSPAHVFAWQGAAGESKTFTASADGLQVDIEGHKGEGRSYLLLIATAVDPDLRGSLIHVIVRDLETHSTILDDEQPLNIQGESAEWRIFLKEPLPLQVECKAFLSPSAK